MNDIQKLKEELQDLKDGVDLVPKNMKAAIEAKIKETEILISEIEAKDKEISKADEIISKANVSIRKASTKTVKSKPNTAVKQKAVKVKAVAEKEKKAATVKKVKVQKEITTAKKTVAEILSKYKSISVKDFNKGRNSDDIIDDLEYQAKAPGKRVSASGHTYYEGRPNRSDISPTKKLQHGGTTEHIIDAFHKGDKVKKTSTDEKGEVIRRNHNGNSQNASYVVKLDSGREAYWWESDMQVCYECGGMMERGGELKVQIKDLVNGGQGKAGTNQQVRNDVAKKVIEQNPNKLHIEISGYKLTLNAHYSTSGKSVNYSTNIPIELYEKYFGNFGLPKESPKAYIDISGDMRITMYTNSNKRFYNTIPNKDIKIIDEYAKGGELDNKDMVVNKATEIAHHAKELHETLKSKEDIPAWVVTKIQRSATDISDVAHYLDGEGKEYAKGGKVKVDRKYTHFAVRKSDNKIVTGWEYKDLDKESIKEYITMDLKDMDLLPKEYTILTKQQLLSKGINPFDWSNWWEHPMEHGGEVDFKVGQEIKLPKDLSYTMLGLKDKEKRGVKILSSKYIIEEIYEENNVKRIRVRNVSTKQINDLYYETFLDKYNFVNKLEHGGSTFASKTKAVAERLEGENVPAKYQSTYGKKYSSKEAKEAADRIIGAQVAKSKMS